MPRVGFHHAAPAIQPVKPAPKPLYLCLFPTDVQKSPFSFRGIQTVGWDEAEMALGPAACPCPACSCLWLPPPQLGPAGPGHRRGPGDGPCPVVAVSPPALLPPSLGGEGLERARQRELAARSRAWKKWQAMKLAH